MKTPYHNHKGKSKIKVQSKKAAMKSKVNADAKTFSKGNGESMAAAGP